MSDFPKISVVTATLNAGKVLDQCFRAIKKQDYPADKVELIIGDGGSRDNTREIAKRYGAKIADNPLKTAEAGKAAALKLASGELIAIIDSDNILPDQDWFKQMVAPFRDPEIVAAEPWEYTYRRSDTTLTRYFALIGMNDPLCLFLGNYDRRNLITNRWTGLKIRTIDQGNYLKVFLTARAMPTIGANGFVIRAAELRKCSVDKYVFDIDLLYELINQRHGEVRVAKVKTGIVHLYSGDVATFVRKQKRRVKDFLYFGREKREASRYPWLKLYLPRVALFGLACVTVVPLLVQMLIGYSRRPDKAWFFHLRACWLTLWIYGTTFLRSKFTKIGQADRSNWRQTG